MKRTIKISTVSVGRKLLASNLILAMLLIASRQTSFSQAKVVTLDSVLHRVERYHPMLQEYESRAKAMNAYVDGAGSWMAPMVGAGPFWYPYPGQELMEERDKGMWMFNLEQDIPNPAKRKAKKNFYASRAAVEEKGRLVRFNQLRSEAKQLYFDWLVIEKKIRLLEESRKIVALMMEVTKARYPYNQSGLSDLYKAEGRLHEVDNMILMTQAEKDDKVFRLLGLMNLPSETRLSIDTSTTVSFNASRITEDTLSLIAKRSDIQQINQSIAMMQLNQQLQRAQTKPDFRVRYEHMQPRGNMITQFSLMAMVSIPIVPWASRMYKSEVAGMNYELEAMQKEKQGILLESRSMLLSMNHQLTRMEQQLTNYQQKILPALRKSYEVEMLAYQENRSQLPAVIDGWEAYNMAQLEYLNKLGDYYTMIVQYEKEAER